MSADLTPRAREIATTAHAGQRDKAGLPYIEHVLRVAENFPEDSAEHIAALLHDVVEDTDWTLSRLRADGFPDEILAAVDALTKREGENRMDAARRAKVNPIARAVKLADNADNTDPTRNFGPTERDLERLREYEAVRELLLSD